MENSNIIKDYVDKYYKYNNLSIIKKNIFYDHYKQNYNKYLNNTLKTNIVNCLKSLKIIEHKRNGIRYFKGIVPNNDDSWKYMKLENDDVVKLGCQENDTEGD